MQVCIDIEANGLINPTQIWVIVCKDIFTNEYYVFREVTKDEKEKERFLEFAQRVDRWIGHNFLAFDYKVLHNLIGFSIPDVDRRVIDTYICSKLWDYPRKKHSIADYGEEFGEIKFEWTDFSRYSPEMEAYCVRDTDICHRIYSKFLRFINDPTQTDAIIREHAFEHEIIQDLERRGFSFNTKSCRTLLDKVTKELEEIDKEIEKVFVPRLKLIREVTPRATKHGTISRTSIPRSLGNDLSIFTVDAPFCYCSWNSFNPSSHKQIVEVLHEAGWQPTEKTDTHIEKERTYLKLKLDKNPSEQVDLELKSLYNDLEKLRKYGWKVSEENLGTLPRSAPAPARLLAKRILLESRRRTLTEWLGLVQDNQGRKATDEEFDDASGRIHGEFFGIGAWTHRMAHQNPNTANIPSEYKEDGTPKLYGGDMRALWRAPRKRLLVGVDAEGIQLRIFAHYIDDQEFTDALVKGDKALKTDPHSLNQRILGRVCKTRQAAKRFIYALLLGAGLGKLAQILEVSRHEADDALGRLMERYTGLAHLKESIIPVDSKRGWFRGIDGRIVKIPGDTASKRKHLAMSGYLQNGEQVVIKYAALQAKKECAILECRQRILRPLADNEVFLTDIVHDEYVIEVPNDVETAEKVKGIFCEAIEDAGIKFKLKCPLKGDGHIGTNWRQIH